MHIWHAIWFAILRVWRESHSAHTPFLLNHGRAAKTPLGVGILTEGLCAFLLHAGCCESQCLDMRMHRNSPLPLSKGISITVLLNMLLLLMMRLNTHMLCGAVEDAGHQLVSCSKLSCRRVEPIKALERINNVVA